VGTEKKFSKMGLAKGVARSHCSTGGRKLKKETGHRFQDTKSKGGGSGIIQEEVNNKCPHCVGKRKRCAQAEAQTLTEEVRQGETAPL